MSELVAIKAVTLPDGNDRPRGRLTRANMKTHTGVIRGNIIELSEDPGLPDGTEVDIQVKTRKNQRPGEGLSRCAGALRDDWSVVDDQILTEIERGRLDTLRRELPQ